MQTIFEVKNGFLGEVREIGDAELAPAGWTYTEPPKLRAGEAARWNGDGWVVVDETYAKAAFAAAAEADFAAVVARKLKEINSACDAQLDGLRSSYPSGEVLSWDQQILEAKDFAASNAAATPLLAAIAAGRGITVAALAEKTMQKAAQFAAASGAMIGHRQYLEDALLAAKTLAEVDAIDVNGGWSALG